MSTTDELISIYQNMTDIYLAFLETGVGEGGRVTVADRTRSAPHSHLLIATRRSPLADHNSVHWSQFARCPVRTEILIRQIQDLE